MNHIVDKSGSMAQALSREITGGVYRSGSKLPGERKLCDYFNVSRTTARTVLNDFETLGIIERRPRSGAYIAEHAVEIIEKRFKKSILQVFFVMPPRQQVNPLLRTIFTAFQQYLDNRIRPNILFLNDITDPVPQLKGEVVVATFSINNDQELNILQSQAEELIVLNRRDDKYNYISPDNYAGGKMMAEYLLESGHKNIGCPLFIQEDKDSDFNRRYLGLKETLEATGKELDTFYIPASRELDEIAYIEAVRHFVVDRKDITALACMSDKMAMHIYAPMNQFDIRIPDNLSVIGFDDQYYAQYTCPPLTTIKFPAEALGIKLANALNNYIKDGHSTIQEVIEPILIKRQSVNSI